MVLFLQMRNFINKVNLGCVKFYANLAKKLKTKDAQGTTEYAILVGVLVVIAILAIVIFKPKLQELWDAIVSGMNSL